MADGFIFGQGSPWSYDELQRKRKIAEQLRRGIGTPQNVGQGLAAIGKALAARNLDKRAAAREDELIGGLREQGLTIEDARRMGIPGFQYGTKSAPGGLAVVGEAGPEIVRLPKGAQVIPNPFTDPSRRDEFEAMTEEEKRRVLEMLNQGMEPDESLAPEGYQPFDNVNLDLRTPRRETFRGGPEFQTAQMGDVELPYGDMKLTGDQSKSIVYYRRGFGANETLRNPDYATILTDWDESMAGNLGALGRMYQSEEFQVANRAAQEFLAAILRKDTGAAITNEEFKLYGPMYLPMPGDKPEMLKAKEKAREEALIAIEMGLGTAAPLAGKVREELQPKKDLGKMSDEELLKMLSGGS